MPTLRRLIDWSCGIRDTNGDPSMVIVGAACVASAAAARDANALRVSNYTLDPNAAAANAHDQHGQPPPNPPFVTISDPAIPLDFPEAVFKHTAGLCSQRSLFERLKPTRPKG